MIKLTKEYWWQEINQARLPHVLKSIVSAQFNGCIPPEANDFDIKAVWQSTQGELEFDGVPYSIVAFVPDDPETHRRFFTLVKKYPGGKLTSLGDVVSRLNLKAVEDVFSGLTLDTRR